MKHRIGCSSVDRADLVVSKTGDSLTKIRDEQQSEMELEIHPLLIRVSKDNSQAHYRGKRLSLLQTYARPRY